MAIKTTLAALCVAFIASQASAQNVIVYRPIAPSPVIAAPVVSAPVVVQRPVLAPVTQPYVTQRPTYVTQRPTVTTFRPAVTAYSPVVSPVTAYSPVVPTTVAARPVIVRPKVYIPGRPLRNLLQAITP